MSLMRIAVCAAVLTTLGIAGNNDDAMAQNPASFFTETFGYADGALNGQGGWANHSGNANTLRLLGGVAQVEARNVNVVNSPPEVDPPTMATSTEDVSRATGFTQAPGETWYYAVKFTVTDRRTSTANSLTTQYFVHFKEEINSSPQGELMFRGRLNITQGTDPAKFGLALSSGTVTFPNPLNDPDFDQDLDVDGNDFLIWQQNLGLSSVNPVANGSGNANNDTIVDDADLTKWKGNVGSPLVGAGQRVAWTSDLDFDTEYTAVVAYTADDDDTNALLTNDGFATLWINPTSISSPSVTDTMPNPNTVNDYTGRPQTKIAMRQGGNGPATVGVNTLAVGADFATVLNNVNNPPMASAVPEPGAAGLLAVGLVALIRRRRR
jgi:hypothetical protein